jgi:hypothetical protein
MLPGEPFDFCRDNFHFNETGYKALIYTETFSSRTYKFAERVRNTLLFKQFRTYKSQANRWGERAGQKCRHNNRY